MSAAPTNECYSPSVYVENMGVSFTPGAGAQSSTQALNSTALSWPGASASAGSVTGVDSGTVTCTVSEGNLVCNYTDGQGCPPPFTGGQCSGTQYNVEINFTVVSGGVIPVTQDADVWGPISYNGFEQQNPSGPPNGQFKFLFSGGTVPEGQSGAGTTDAWEPLFTTGQNDGSDLTITSIVVTPLNSGLDNCGDPAGDCGDSGSGTVPVTYNGCFPQSEPAPDPPTEPADPPLEPNAGGSSAPSAPSPGVGEPGGGLPGFGPPRRVSGTSVTPITPAAPDPPVNQNIPWYPIYQTEATDSSDFLFFLPPLFTVREGVDPTLTAWNGVAVFVNAPGDVETGSTYRSAYATPVMALNELDTNKRIGKFSTSLKNTNTELWSPLNNFDSSTWGQFKYPMNVNASYLTENVEAETAYSLYSFDELTYPYSAYELPDFVTFVEHFKGTSNRFQAAVWSTDEFQWYLEGFQLQANTKGKRVKRVRRR